MNREMDAETSKDFFQKFFNALVTSGDIKKYCAIGFTCTLEERYVNKPTKAVRVDLTDTYDAERIGKELSGWNKFEITSIDPGEADSTNSIHTLIVRGTIGENDDKFPLTAWLDLIDDPSYDPANGNEDTWPFLLRSAHFILEFT